MPTLYCSFNKSVGWRIVATSKRESRIGVVDFKNMRCLMIPATQALRNGWFCNPAKLAIAFLHRQPKPVGCAAIKHLTSMPANSRGDSNDYYHLE